MITDIKVKTEDLSDFDEGQNHYGLMTGNVDIGNSVFGGMFTCCRCEHVPEVVYGWQSLRPAICRP